MMDRKGFLSPQRPEEFVRLQSIPHRRQTPQLVRRSTRDPFVESLNLATTAAEPNYGRVPGECTYESWVFGVRLILKHTVSKTIN